MARRFSSFACWSPVTRASALIWADWRVDVPADEWYEAMALLMSERAPA